MGDKLNRQYGGVNQVGNQHVSIPRHSQNYNRPFWLPAVSYYFLTVAVVLAAFFIVWWFLQDPNGGTPWIPAGVFSSVLLVGAVLLREIVLRNAMSRHIAAKRRLDTNLNRAASSVPAGLTKFTLQQNAEVLSEIKRKSNAARTLTQLPDAHLEVFEMSEEYLKFTKQELNSMSVGSPRFGAIRRGRRRAKEFHKYHLLAWAAIESGYYTREAQTCDTLGAKIENAQKALDVLNAALHFYPQDVRLLESSDVVKELLTSTEISHRIEMAEKAEKDGDYKTAIGSYKDALFNLAKEEVRPKETKALAQKITFELNRLREIAEESTEKNKFSEPDNWRQD